MTAITDQRSRSDRARTAKYVVAFNRDRDFYQLPLALHQKGLLASLVTDFYYPYDRPLRWVPGLSVLDHRCITGLPSRLVHCSINALLPQLLAKFRFTNANSLFTVVDHALSDAALSYAERENAHLFLYSYYAFRAFTSDRARGMIKGLFMVHPHMTLAQDILDQDFSVHPECRFSYEAENLITATSGRCCELRDEWKYASFIICASEFTARSLRHAGCPPDLITVAPYGIELPDVPFSRMVPNNEACRFLFVGQGVQRKGLHHLLLAWRRACFSDATLTVIATNIDPGIAALAGPGVTLLPRQSRAELIRHYNSHHVFVMPSLIEGFGLVYLEALAAGCYCIGTRNTGLPDLEALMPAGLNAISTFEAGDIDALTGTLEAAFCLHKARNIDHSRIRMAARALNWQHFRESVAATARAQFRA